MKNKIFILLLYGFICLNITGCNNNKEIPKEEYKEPTKESTKETKTQLSGYGNIDKTEYTFDEIIKSFVYFYDDKKYYIFKASDKILFREHSISKDDPQISLQINDSRLETTRGNILCKYFDYSKTYEDKYNEYQNNNKITITEKNDESFKAIKDEELFITYYYIVKNDNSYKEFTYQSTKRAKILSDTEAFNYLLEAASCLTEETNPKEAYLHDKAALLRYPFNKKIESYRSSFHVTNTSVRMYAKSKESDKGSYFTKIFFILFENVKLEKVSDKPEMYKFTYDNKPYFRLYDGKYKYDIQIDYDYYEGYDYIEDYKEALEILQRDY